MYHMARADLGLSLVQRAPGFWLVRSPLIQLLRDVAEGSLQWGKS